MCYDVPDSFSSRRSLAYSNEGVTVLHTAAVVVIFVDYIVVSLLCGFLLACSLVVTSVVNFADDLSIQFHGVRPN